MKTFGSLLELQTFASALRIPAERREIVAEELEAHVTARIAEGVSETEALESLGSPALLERLLTPAERRFSPSPAEVVFAALRVSAVVIVAQLAASTMYGRVPVRWALAIHVALVIALLAAVLPPWARRARYHARCGFAILGWTLSMLPALLVNRFFPVPPPPDAVGAMLLALWFAPTAVLFAAVPLRSPAPGR